MIKDITNRPNPVNDALRDIQNSTRIGNQDEEYRVDRAEHSLLRNGDLDNAQVGYVNELAEKAIATNSIHDIENLNRVLGDIAYEEQEEDKREAEMTQIAATLAAAQATGKQ